MKISLSGRVALVTGGSRGIGRAIALGLAEAGADVAVNYRRDVEAANGAVAAIEAMGRRAKAYSASVEHLDAMQAMVDAVVADLGGIDILIHNAGVASRGYTVAETDAAEMERLWRVHTLGPHQLSKMAIPHMRKRGRGDIIVISSAATRVHAANSAPYTMAKAGSEALAFALAKEEQRYGIRANVVCPGLTDTDMGQRLAKAMTGGGDIHDLDEQYPFGRVGTPEDIARMVTFMVSDANSYSTGQKIYVDGGQMADS